MTYEVLPPAALLERLLGAERLGVLTFGTADLNEGWNGEPTFRRTTLSHHMLWGIEEGELTAHDRGVERPIPEGSLLWVHGGCDAHFSLRGTGGRARVLFLRFSDGETPPLSLRNPLLIAPKEDEGLAVFRSLLRLLGRTEGEKNPLDRLHLRCRLADLLACILRGSPTGPETETPGRTPGLQPHHRRACLDYIRTHLTDFFRLDELAEAVRLNPVYLSRSFRQSFGISIQTFIKRMRIAEGKRLLLSTGKSVSEIAAALGYRDLYYFSRQFKEETGLSPKRWRSEALG